MRRPVLVKPPPEFGLHDKVLKVVRPNYCMPESPVHWFATFVRHHTEHLDMIQIAMDPCLLHKRNGTEVGIVGVQVDDTLIAGNESFIKTADAYSHTFPNKDRVPISNVPALFNGISISNANETTTASQKDYLANIPTLKTGTDIMSEEFRSIPAQYAYDAYYTVPEILVRVSHLAQITDKLFANDPARALKDLRLIERL